MKAEERTISQILTNQVRYEIPPYQRPYSWDKDNVQQLLEDLQEAYDAQDKEYFIGSLITIERERDKFYDVVDGQQRLTTLNLILARLRDHIEDGASKALLQNCLMPQNPLTGEAEAPRLSLRKKDQSFFRKHILESQPIQQDKIRGLDVPQQNLIQNAAVIDTFFAEKSEQHLKLLANFILSSVYVVFVTTFSFDSAYRLFNVLNARGMPLSNADLIKNSLFSQLNGKDGGSEALEEAWLELEGIIGIELLDTFFGHYRTTLTADKASQSLHKEIDTLIKGKGDPFAFLDAVTQAAGQYVRILDGDFESPDALRSLHALRRVKYEDWIPPLLIFLSYGVDGMDEATFIDLLEKITMQNWVRRLGSTARLTIYFQLIRAIREHQPADNIKALILEQASNKEFLQLLGSDIYGKPFTNAVLLRLEEASQDESVTKTFSGLITIEHVLPQALKDPYWTERFEEEVHQEWVHKLGNLTPLSGRKNYEAQCFSFDRKKKIYQKKLNKVSFDITKEVCDQPEWTLETIKNRHNKLLALAEKTWFIS
jgi:hypothetical protein